MLGSTLGHDPLECGPVCFIFRIFFVLREHAAGFSGMFVAIPNYTVSSPRTL
jgi:hypothetical protein